MILFFWICTILLTLAYIGSFAQPTQVRWGRAAFVLVVIDLIIINLIVLGVKGMGEPH